MFYRIELEDFGCWKDLGDRRFFLKRNAIKCAMSKAEFLDTNSKTIFRIISWFHKNPVFLVVEIEEIGPTIVTDFKLYDNAEDLNLSDDLKKP